MKLLRTITITLSLFSAMTAYADLPMEGHTGIFMMRGADTLAPGDYSYSVGMVSNQLPITGTGTYYFIHDFMFNFNQGINERLEFGLGFPQRFSSANPTWQIAQLNTSLKYRLKGSREEGQVLSLTWYTSMFPAPAAAGLGTGTRNAGLELNYTQFGPMRDVHLNYGIEQVDNVSVAAGPVITFTNTAKLYWKMGMEQRVNEHTSYVLGTSMHLDFVSFSSQMMVGAAYRYRNEPTGFSYTVGVSYNVLRTADEPRFRYMIGLNYKLDSPKSKMYNMEQRLQQMEASLQRMENNMQQQQQQMNQMQSQDQALYEQELPAIRQEISNLRNEMTEMQGEQQAMAGAIENLGQAPVVALTPPPAPEPPAAAPEVEAPVEEAPPVVAVLPNLPRVQIVNESGVAGLGDRYAGQMAEKGYPVVETNEVEGKSNKTTYIYYRPGFAEQAIEIGHTMPRNQIVLQSKTLPDGVDVLIVLGEDVQ